MMTPFAFSTNIPTLPGLTKSLLPILTPPLECSTTGAQFCPEFQQPAPEAPVGISGFTG
jgi:hypothetical protein